MDDAGYPESQGEENTDDRLKRFAAQKNG